MARSTVRQSTTTLNAASLSFARHLRAEGKSPQTISTYMKAINQFTAHLASTGKPATVATVTRADVEEWLNHLRDEKALAPATVAQRYRSLQQFAKWLLAEGETTTNIFANLAPPTIPDNPPQVISEDEIRALLATMQATNFMDRRDSAILRLFYATGIRLAEMAGLRITDLDLDHDAVTVTGKFDRTRTVTFGPRTARALDRYLRIRDTNRHAGEPWLWLGERGRLTPFGISQMVKRRGEDAGLGWIHPHLFRHSWAAASLNRGLHEQDVSALAGWRSPQMVTRYGRAVRDQRAQARHRENNPGEGV